MRLFGGLLALLLLAGCGHTSDPTVSPHRQVGSSAPATASDGPARLTRARCADLVIVGLRGQGQSRRGHDGAGKDVDGVARAMLRHLRPGTTVRIDGVPFPARSGGDATYAEDVRTGVRLVRDRLAVLAQGCPASRVALVGYSQGAEVVHRSAVATTDPAQLAAVVLIGDPVRNPEDHVQTLVPGPGVLSGRGNGGVGARFPDAVRQLVLEVCAPADDVCDAPPAGRVGPPSTTHRTAYKSRPTQHRVAALAARSAVGAGV
jgi:cutinase